MKTEGPAALAVPAHDPLPAPEDFSPRYWRLMPDGSWQQPVQTLSHKAMRQLAPRRQLGGVAAIHLVATLRWLN